MVDEKRVPLCFCVASGETALAMLAEPAEGLKIWGVGGPGESLSYMSDVLVLTFSWSF